jgi:hypothetical protein
MVANIIIPKGSLGEQQRFCHVRKLQLGETEFMSLVTEVSSTETEIRSVADRGSVK